MSAYNKSYLDEVVETQGQLFDYVSINYKDKDTIDFINAYMNGKTREYIDNCQAYVNTKDAIELLEYFLQTDNYKFKQGEALNGFIPNWIGQFYAYYQWYYDVSSKELIKNIPVDFLIKAYNGLHDLDLELAIKKVGNVWI